MTKDVGVLTRNFEWKFWCPVHPIKFVNTTFGLYWPNRSHNAKLCIKKLILLIIELCIKILILLIIESKLLKQKMHQNDIEWLKNKLLKWRKDFNFRQQIVANHYLFGLQR
ncbi:hypothetical protein V6Z12_D02G155100 [Gossypium hirsutum]